MTYRRYNESPISKSGLLISTRINSSKDKIKGFINSSSTPKNPQVQIRLPQLSRSSIKKSFSIFQSDRNTKFKLTTLEQKLTELQTNIHLVRQQSKESIQFTKNIKTILIDKQLSGIEKDLKQQILGFKNLINCTKNDHRVRVNDIRQDCNSLWYSNQSIKQQIFSLRMKVEQVQKLMGYQK